MVSAASAKRVVVRRVAVIIIRLSGRAGGSPAGPPPASAAVLLSAGEPPADQPPRPAARHICLIRARNRKVPGRPLPECLPVEAMRPELMIDARRHDERPHRHRQPQPHASVVEAAPLVDLAVPPRPPLELAVEPRID